jgi:ATP-dependent DNA helicase RecG
VSAEARTLAELADVAVERLTGPDAKALPAKKLEALHALEITTVLDLLTHYPRRYIDRTEQALIRDLKVGDEAMVLATVKRVQSRRSRNGKSLVEIDVFDGSSYLSVTFFNQAWRAKQLAVGTEAVLFGKLDVYRGRRQMANPIVDLIGDKTGKVVPVYPQSEKAPIATWEIAKYVEQALKRAGTFADPLPEAMRRDLDLADRHWAMRNIHQPETMGAAMTARKRLAFDELLRLQTVLVARKRHYEATATGIRHEVGSPLVTAFTRRCRTR